MSEEEIQRFLDWCFTTDPDFDPPAEPGNLRELISDTGGQGLCAEVSAECALFAGLCDVERHAVQLYIPLPHPRYPGAEEYDGGHTVCLVDGICYDFTARQFGDHYPVPYVWTP